MGKRNKFLQGCPWWFAWRPVKVFTYKGEYVCGHFWMFLRWVRRYDYWSNSNQRYQSSYFL